MADWTLMSLKMFYTQTNPEAGKTILRTYLGFHEWKDDVDSVWKEVSDNNVVGLALVNCVSFMVKNTGSRDGDEVTQFYFRHVHSDVPQPKLTLCGFVRMHLNRGETGHVTVEVPAERLRYWDTERK